MTTMMAVMTTTRAMRMMMARKNGLVGGKVHNKQAKCLNDLRRERKLPLFLSRAPRQAS